MSDQTIAECSFHTKKGQQTPNHDCPKNWYGSSKAT